ncbi:hypothetical protein C0Q70_17521 [Pomacea canaliculata]|uniref:Uncharacterized protein n=1 Tax=Pomacea canaliculata TaxID=400727 RepID=A0A2T7NKN9_POMCA|nr:hypothetical protein C0Q70_17521 [Pomacea canaliculata]
MDTTTSRNRKSMDEESHITDVEVRISTSDRPTPTTNPLNYGVAGVVVSCGQCRWAEDYTLLARHEDLNTLLAGCLATRSHRSPSTSRDSSSTSETTTTNHAEERC